MTCSSKGDHITLNTDLTDPNKRVDNDRNSIEELVVSMNPRSRQAAADLQRSARKNEVSASER